MVYSFVFFDRSDRSRLPPSLKKKLVYSLTVEMAIQGCICFLYVQFSAGLLLSRSKNFKILNFCNFKTCIIQFISLVLHYLLEARARVDLITLSNDRNVQTSRNLTGP